PPVFHDPGRFLNSYRETEIRRSGLVFLRRITPLSRRDAVYFCSGVYIECIERRNLYPAMPDVT
ncbi:MAG TPA: hypothetical protein VFP59_05680, partial [Candidatus Angelobacter sp.]|nr:hypothetical protein [Candidatus Angelobacter sp.]